MILPSKEIFIPKYIDGSKKHSIRKGNRWRAGMTIHHYAKNRQPDMYKFMEDRSCISTQKIFMTCSGWDVEVSVDGKYLYKPDIKQIAINDGFDSVESFFEFFFPKYKKGEFSGQIVHWTDLKY